jgi:NitT/TauT family transport system permease protein
MNRTPNPLAGLLALLLIGLAFTQPLEEGTRWWSSALALLCGAALLEAARRTLRPSPGAAGTAALAVVSLVAGALLLALPATTREAMPAAGFWLALAALAVLAVVSVQRLAALDGHAHIGSWTAALFGLWVLFFWQVGVTAFDVPRVLLPAPSQIGHALLERSDLLVRDFVQTVLKGVVVGWVVGCALGFAVGVAIDRVPFLQRGLLPVASLSSTLPLVGVAPIAVMWFGFEWPSKAAVVVLMTFFPMLVSTLAGLQAAGRLELELMKTYAASYLRTLIDLRLPAAVPFIVSALKVNATLALIGGIVAEFFGSPTVGLGFRISTEAAKMNMGLVWSAIVVASVTGSLAYAALVRLERHLAFWHPSVRG